MRGVQVGFFVAAIALFAVASANDSRQSLQCKNIARDVIINSCKGPRHKRSTDETATESPLQATFPPVTNKPQASTTLAPAHTEKPTETITHASEHRDEHSFMGIRIPNPIMDGIRLGRNPFFRRLEDDYSPRLMEHRMRYARSAEARGDSLSPEDLEELYEEVGDRLPRNSKQDNMRIFQRVASICCGNVKLCYDDPSRVPCFGN